MHKHICVFAFKNKTDIENGAEAIYLIITKTSVVLQYFHYILHLLPPVRRLVVHLLPCILFFMQRGQAALPDVHTIKPGWQCKSLCHMTNN